MRGEKASKKRKSTLVTTPVVIKNTARVATWKRTFARTRENVHFTALGWVARKSLLAPTSSPGITAHIRARKGMSVGSAASVLWEATIFQSTRKHTDWSPAKNWTDPRTPCSFESERVGCALEGQYDNSSPPLEESRAWACVLTWLLLSYENCAVTNRIHRGHFPKV